MERSFFFLLSLWQVFLGKVVYIGNFGLLEFAMHYSSLLTFPDSTEKSAVNLVGLSSCYCGFSLPAPNDLSLFCIFSVLTILLGGFFSGTIYLVFCVFPVYAVGMS